MRSMTDEGAVSMWQTPDRTRRARRLRRALNSTEAAFWNLVRDRRLDGLKFRRQTPIAGYVVDFCCPEVRLMVELDGGVHNLRLFEDAARSARIEAAGYRVIRETNSVFMRNPNRLLAAIRDHVALGSSAPSSEPLCGPPSPPGGEGQR